MGTINVVQIKMTFEQIAKMVLHKVLVRTVMTGGALLHRGFRLKTQNNVGRIEHKKISR